MTREVVCKVADVAEGRLTPARLGRAKLLLTRLGNGTIRAVAARCPHQGADLEAGCVAAFVDSDRPNELAITKGREVLRCPWHGFEFDLASGEAAVPPPEHRNMKLRMFAVEIEGDEVVIVT